MNLNKTKMNSRDEKPANPPCSPARTISDKEKERTLETTLSLEKP
jgi:hypothetical protein